MKARFVGVGEVYFPMELVYICQLYIYMSDWCQTGVIQNAEKTPSPSMHV